MIRSASHVDSQVEVAFAQVALSALSRPYSVLPVGQLIHKLTDANSHGSAKKVKKQYEWVAVPRQHGVLVVAEDPGPATAPGVTPRPVVECHHSTTIAIVVQRCNLPLSTTAKSNNDALPVVRLNRYES